MHRWGIRILSRNYFNFFRVRDLIIFIDVNCRIKILGKLILWIIYENIPIMYIY